MPSPAVPQQLFAPMLNQPRPRYPNPSRPECLSRHVLPILWQTQGLPSLVHTSGWLHPPQKNTLQGAHTLPGPAYCPRWSPHPSRTSLLPKVILTPFQDQYISLSTSSHHCGKPTTTALKLSTQLPPWSCMDSSMSEAVELTALPSTILYTS